MSDTVEITLNGEALGLKPTLLAFKEINAKCGGFRNALQNVAYDYNAEIITQIIASGLGKRVKDVEEPVFKTPQNELIGPVTDFVTILMNGGKRPVDGEEKKTVSE